MIENLLQAERLLLHGLVDQAELIYQRTLEADPRNAIALVGLARVALERADDRLAYQHTCAALEIDRRNPAALRLEARLSEILTARGQDVERPAWLATEAPPTTPPTAPPSAPRDRPAETVTEPSAEPADAPPIDQAAERAVFARNPSMDDHRRMESQREGPAPAPAPDERAPAPDERAPEPPAKRRGLLRRLLGR